MQLKNFKKLMQDGRMQKVIIACGLLGIALIFISSLGSLNGDRKSEQGSTVSDYKTELQSSLTDILSKIEGVGRASVFLTVESGAENTYAFGSQTKEPEPPVRGVIVVCDGGDDPLTVEKVIDAVTRSLGISSAKVCVGKLKD